MKSEYQILIIGAGTAGITVAAQLLRKNNDLDIAIIDPASKHYYQPAWTLVGGGTYDYSKTEREMKGLIPAGADWIQESVEIINPDNNELTLKDGTTLTYRYLIACPGIQINIDGIEGLKASINKNEVCSVYVNSKYTWQVIKNFKGGTALFTQADTPIKCGGAPQKVMYMADDHFTKTDIRDKTDITYIMPGSTIFGVKEFKKTLMNVVDRKKIELRYFHSLVKIDGEKKLAYYKIKKPELKPEELYYHLNPNIKTETENDLLVVHYDMIHLAPPQSAPDFIKQSKLANQEGPKKGWIDVNINTLQHNQYSNVFALGDAAALPTGKTGAAVRKQAPVVVENILHLINNESILNNGYTGYSSCPIVTGYGKMVLAEFDYNNNRMSDPLISKFVDTTKEQYSMWLLKKYGLPFIYWNLMLKGKV